jgi:hypothetical protein
MAEPNDLEARVSTPAARVLAGGADRDVAEIRGEIRDFRDQNTRVLNAMRADLTDLRQRTERGFAEAERGFAEVRGKLDGAAAGQQQIVDLLNTLVTQRDGPAGEAG